MADWRQVQARIRKAKASAEAPKQLAELYERTRDAMVAFELAQWHERAGDNAEAARWYTVAAEKFRRAQWRTKAESALARLGAPLPATTALAETEGSAFAAPLEAGEQQERLVTEEEVPAEIGLFTSGAAIGEAPTSDEQESAPAEAASAAKGADARTKRRRRGRRGGRNRRGRGAGQAPGAQGRAESAAKPIGDAPVVTSPELAETMQPAVPIRAEVAPVSERLRSTPSRHAEELEEAPPRFERPTFSRHAGGTRAGEPALASRIAHLEAQIRRLLACPQASIEDADQAPAGPGVLLLSDSDQVTHYYIEACQTLRIGIGNLLRGGRGSRDAGALKERMAENLGVSESRVSKYIKDHCIVRWLQLDEGGSELAHFAISVLRPVAND